MVDPNELRARATDCDCDVCEGLRAAADEIEALRQALDDTQKWLAAVAYGKSKAEHRILINSPRWKKSRALLAAIKGGG